MCVQPASLPPSHMHVPTDRPTTALSSRCIQPADVRVQLRTSLALEASVRPSGTCCRREVLLHYFSSAHMYLPILRSKNIPPRVRSVSAERLIARSSDCSFVARTLPPPTIVHAPLRAGRTKMRNGPEKRRLGGHIAASKWPAGPRPIARGEYSASPWQFRRLSIK